MKKVKAIAAASLIGASAVVAGGNLWDFANALSASNDPYWGQVKAPGVIYCWDNAPPLTETNEYASPCYDQTGGYWFGYGDEGGKAVDAVSNTDLTVSRALVTNEYNETLNKQEWKTGAGLGNATEGLHVKFVLTGGTDSKPSLAGIGFNWRQKDNTDYEGKKTENIEGKGGICLRYKSDGPAPGVDVELGWNEGTNGYNTYVNRLAASSSWKTVDLPWSAFDKSYDDVTAEKSVALTQAEALKIAFKNKGSEPVTVTFTLGELGWQGTCTGSGAVSTNSVATAVSPQFNLAGRMLSMVNVSAPTQVQIINMHGSVVAQKSLGQNEQLNLANMPNGVYLVRSAKLGISQKIILK